MLAAWIHPAPSGWIVLARSMVGIALATVAAAISWKYLEEPLIKRGHRYKYRVHVAPDEKAVQWVVAASASPSP